MSRDNGRMTRAFGRLFRERQIYHRSEGVVRFVKLSARTQIALATVMGIALLWVAYASVNVVFKEQIIVSKEQERRDQEAAFRTRLQNAEKAYQEVDALNFYYTSEFEATIAGLNRQHETLRALVENKSTVDRRYDELSKTLSAAGFPGGKRPKTINRLMIDPVGREPTPRQSRMSALREEALHTTIIQRTADMDDEFLEDMRLNTAELSSRQVVLMAGLEQDMRRSIRELSQILGHTGIDVDTLVDRHRVAALAEVEGDENGFIGQGGPLIPPDGLGGTGAYFKSAARIDGIYRELVTLKSALEDVPLSPPILVRHRMTSGFGMRWDPITRNKRSAHRGLDFAAHPNSPLVATAPGRVSFAGRRSGFGLTVEIDHGSGFKTRYAHMNKINVRVGQQVDLHDNIGLLGSTGRSTGYHVHYEVHYYGRQIDPLKFIEAGRYVFES